jgi:hypothetical protein
MSNATPPNQPYNPQNQPPYGQGQPAYGPGPQQPYGPGQGVPPRPPQAAPQPAAAAPKKSRKGLIGGLIVGFALGSIIGCAGGVGIGGGTSTTAVPGATVTVTEKPEAGATVTEKADPAPTVTVTEKAPADEPADPPAEGFGPGTYIVGEDIPPGRYKAKADGDNCYWARLKDDSGDFESIIANNNTAGSSTVTIKKSDGAFETSGCTPWIKQ